MSIFFGDDDREEVEIRPLTDMSTWVGDYTAHLSMAHGLRGKGKSLFVNVFGHKLKFDSWTYRGRSPNPMPGSVSISPYGEIKVHDGDYRKLVTNINLQGADIYEESVFKTLSDERVNNEMMDSVIVIDEIGEIVPTIRSTSRVVHEFSHYLTMMRKVQSEMLSTTQFPDAVAKRFAQQLDWLYKPRIHKWKVEIDGVKYIRAYLDVEVWNYNGSVTEYPVTARYIHEMPPPQRKFRMWGVERAFDWYDTWETVLNPHTTAGKAEYARMDDAKEYREQLFGPLRDGELPATNTLKQEQVLERLDIIYPLDGGWKVGHIPDAIREFGLFVDSEGDFVKNRP